MFVLCFCVFGVFCVCLVFFLVSLVLEVIYEPFCLENVRHQIGLDSRHWFRQQTLQDLEADIRASAQRKALLCRLLKRTHIYVGIPSKGLFFCNPQQPFLKIYG